MQKSSSSMTLKILKNKTIDLETFKLDIKPRQKFREIDQLDLFRTKPMALDTLQLQTNHFKLNKPLLIRGPQIDLPFKEFKK